MKWENSDEGTALVKEKFDQWAAEGHANIGVLVGAPSGDLIDIDLDHPKAMRLKDHFLPRTAMRSGRSGRPNSHYWYRATEGTLPATRVYKLEDLDTVTVELRSTGAQTAVPPSTWTSKEGDRHEEYLWGGAAWGGDAGPALVDGRVLQVQVAVLALGTLLVEHWPTSGSRHQAYLALAGGLLRVGEGIHPYWERNAPALIGAMADATDDDDGPESRIHEVMDTTLKRLREGKAVAGFGKLGEILGEQVVKHVRTLVGDVEAAAGVPSRASGSLSVEQIAQVVQEHEDAKTEREVSEENAERDAGFEARDPLEERLGTWEAVDLDPYLSGQVEPIMPAVMHRTDGKSLMYRGRVNMIYGPSEAAKSWIAMTTCLQVMDQGERVVYLDFEDEPVQAIQRMQLLGAGFDDLRNQFTYVRPEEPLAAMQISRWGEMQGTDESKLNQELFQRMLERVDPTLIIADGMTELYGLHGLDTNDTVQTSTITRWLKRLTRNGRSTVVVIDHTPKNATKGTMPIGSQHKRAMVQGTLLQAYPIKQPMPGVMGEIELYVLKDRPGNVRAVSEVSGELAQLAATVSIDSTNAGSTHITFHAPVDKRAAAAAAMATKQQLELDLQRQKEAERAQRANEWEERVKFLFGGDLTKKLKMKEMVDLLFEEPTAPQRRELRRTVERLKEQGWIEQMGETKGAWYELRVGGAGYDVPLSDFISPEADLT